MFYFIALLFHFKIYNMPGYHGIYLIVTAHLLTYWLSLCFVAIAYIKQ